MFLARFASLCIFFASVIAQGYSYIDESGNIHFVESIDMIPEKYKSQVLKPTPTLDPTQYAKILRKLPKKKPTPKPTPTKKGVKNKRR